MADKPTQYAVTVHIEVDEHNPPTCFELAEIMSKFVNDYPEENPIRMKAIEAIAIVVS